MEEKLIIDRPKNWRGRDGKAFRIWQRDNGSIRVARQDAKGWLEWEPTCSLEHFLFTNPRLAKFRI